MHHNVDFLVQLFKSLVYKVSIRKSLRHIMSSRIMNFAQVRQLGNILTQGIKEYSEWPTIPQLYVNGEFVGGCDIVMNMHQSGELEKVLDDADVLVPAEEAEQEAATEGKEVLVGQQVVEDIGVVHGEQVEKQKPDVKSDI